MTIIEPLRVVEDEWPELARKLPPEAPSDDQRGKSHQLRKAPAIVGMAGAALQRMRRTGPTPVGWQHRVAKG
jgi:hypothetical protein